jgi:hypothetical protein
MYLIELYQTTEQVLNFMAYKERYLNSNVFMLKEVIDVERFKQDLSEHCSVYKIPKELKNNTAFHKVTIWIDKDELDHLLNWSLSLHPIQTWLVLFQRQLFQSSFKKTNYTLQEVKDFYTMLQEINGSDDITLL